MSEVPGGAAASGAAASGAAASGAAAGVAFTPYQRKLFVFLSVAGFFEGYDMFAFASILPALRKDWALDTGQVGLLAAVVNVGTVVAYLLIRRADQWGRRPVLTLTIAGYTVFTFLSGLAPDLWTFAALQLVARVFLIGEYAISVVVAAEEFPAARRGLVIGVINGSAAFGSVFCAGVVPFLIHAPWGWRTVYFVGVIPLIILAFARRGLRETARFEQQQRQAREAASAGVAPAATDLLRIWRTPHWRRVLTLALIWGLTYTCTQPSVTFWKDFALHERGLTEKQAGLIISVAFVLSMPFVFLVGRMLDSLGRRRGAVIIYGCLVGGVLAGYTLHGFPALLVSMCFGVFGITAVLPLLNALTTELFPTEIRGDAYAWVNNLLGRIGYVAGPWLVGLAARDSGWGPVMAACTALPALALVVLLVTVPETKGRELEEVATA